MAYLNLDDNFTDHPKIDQLSDGAFRLYLAALCYSAKHLTDGRIPSDRPPRLVPGFRQRYLDELVKHGLWLPFHDGYEIHDFLQWNKPRSWWEKKRAEDAERKRQWREAQKSQKDKETG